MKFFLNVLSAVCAVVAAVYWFRSASVELPKNFPLMVYTSHRLLETVIGSEIGATGSSPEIDALGQAMIKQSELSAIAARWACAAAALQAAALGAEAFGF